VKGSLTQTLKAPTGLVAARQTDSEIALSWRQGAGTEDGFEIERSLTGDAWTSLALTAADITSYNDTGLAPFTQYFYRVRAFDALGPTPYSNVASASTATPGGVRIDTVAAGEIPVAGLRTRTYLSTQSNDKVTEAIQEAISTGTYALRFSYLEHKWFLDIPGGSTVTFFLKAYKIASTEGDDFVFAYSLDDSTYTDMLTVTRTVDDGTYQSVVLPNSIRGRVYVRVRDTDRTPGRQRRDSIYVDHLFIRSE
jgi:hypothetical protein